MRAPTANLLTTMLSVPAVPVGVSEWLDGDTAAEGAMWMLLDAGPLPTFITFTGDGDDVSAVAELVEHLRRCSSVHSQRPKTIDGQVLTTHAYVRLATTASELLHIENQWQPLHHVEECRWAFLSVEWFDPNALNEGIV